MIDQALLSFSAVLIYNLQPCILTLSFLSLTPPPSIIQSFILSLPYFSSHFHTLCLPVSHQSVPLAFPLTLPQPRCHLSTFLQCFGQLFYCNSMPLHYSFAFPFKMCFLFNNLPQPLYRISPSPSSAIHFSPFQPRALGFFSLSVLACKLLYLNERILSCLFVKLC